MTGYYRPRRICTACNAVTDTYHGRGLCKAHYDREYNRGRFADNALPTLPPPGLSPILRTKANQAPTDPGLTPKRVSTIGNTNGRRVLLWLATHPEHATEALYDALVWRPAETEGQRVAA